MRIVHKNNWYRIKVTDKLYINIRFLLIIPIFYICYDNRTVDKFFDYLIIDAMWDEC